MSWDGNAAVAMLMVIGLVVGIYGDRPVETARDYAGICMVVLLFVLLGFLWQASHGWPGLMSGAFAEVVGLWVVCFVFAAILGNVLGRVIESCKRRVD